MGYYGGLSRKLSMREIRWLSEADHTWSTSGSQHKLGKVEMQTVFWCKSTWYWQNHKVHYHISSAVIERGYCICQIPLWESNNALQWRHNEYDDVSNYQHLKCLLNHLYRHKSKKTSKRHISGLCEGNPLMTSGFLSERASNAENVSIWWHHEQWYSQWYSINDPITCL